MKVIVPDARAFDLRLQDRFSAGVFGGSKTQIQPTGNYRFIGSIGYNGEKNYGELGPARDYWPDYNMLRARSWQLYLESEIAQTVLNKFVLWVIGSGLKLQSEPMEGVLKSAGIEIDRESFTSNIEEFFKLYCKSRMADYRDMESLNIIESEAFKNSIIGGDMLVILRYIDGDVKVQIVDGEHIQSPMYGSDIFPHELPNGNRIVEGIEIDQRGQHVAFYIRKDYRTFEFERIAARGSDTNALMAFMVYGSKYRIDNHRGMPLLSVMMETAKKLERYKEAVVGSAEERQKIAYTIEHEAFSTGENPLAKQTMVARNVDWAYEGGFIPRDDAGNELANKFTATTNKQAFNLPLGASIKALESKNELYFKEFYTVNIMLFCASANIPYEVAMSKYDSNYSASRGAMKDWEHVLGVRRTNFGFQFKQPIYDFWLEVMILSQKVKAPGYIKARVNNDRTVLEAYRNARHIGAPVPHIDPVKEVEAERLKLGEAGAAIPLTTVEQATENLNGGDSYANVKQFAEELKESKKLGIKVEDPNPVLPNKPAK